MPRGRHRPKCTAPNCNRDHAAKGLCTMHYRRRKRTGSLTCNYAERGAASELLLAFAKRKDAECIDWPLPLSSTGYGYCRFRGKRGGAHRFICELAHGKPPFPRAHAAHNCGNRACVNPMHIRWATSAENQKDKIKHGRTNRGQKSPTNKLSPNQVRSIRKRLLCGEGPRHLGREFGVHHTTIRSIGSRKTWYWLED